MESDTLIYFLVAALVVATYFLIKQIKINYNEKSITMKNTKENNRQKLWIKSFVAYTLSDKPMKTSNDAERWADDALKAFDRTFKVLIILILFIPAASQAQSKQVTAMAGYKAFEVSAAYVAESELIFGLAVMGASAHGIEQRANKNDVNKKVHALNGEVVPAVFGLIGGEFDELSIIGKLGGTYIDQSINGTPTKDIFFAVGIAFDYKLTDDLAFRVSYDNVAGPMAGATIHF